MALDTGRPSASCHQETPRRCSQLIWPPTGHALQGPQSVKNWSPQLVCQGTEGELPPAATCGDSVCCRVMLLSVGLGGPCRVQSCFPGLYPLHFRSSPSPNRHVPTVRSTPREGNRDCSRDPSVRGQLPLTPWPRPYPGAQQKHRPFTLLFPSTAGDGHLPLMGD